MHCAVSSCRSIGQPSRDRPRPEDETASILVRSRIASRSVEMYRGPRGGLEPHAEKLSAGSPAGIGAMPAACQSPRWSAHREDEIAKRSRGPDPVAQDTSRIRAREQFSGHQPRREGAARSTCGAARHRATCPADGLYDDLRAGASRHHPMHPRWESAAGRAGRLGGLAGRAGGGRPDRRYARSIVGSRFAGSTRAGGCASPKVPMSSARRSAALVTISASHAGATLRKERR